MAIQEVRGIKYRFSSEWIHKLEGEEHWRAYWHQANMVLPQLVKGDHILEIGPGSGFISNYLISKGYKVTTLDIDKDKSPDIVANLVEYDFPNQYDVILAFEVFEHIPYEEFLAILPKLKVACRSKLFLSIPLNRRYWFKADLIIPYFKNVSFGISAKRRKINTSHHFWELEYKKFSMKSLVRDLRERGFDLEKTSKFMMLRYMQLSAQKTL